MIWYDWLWPKLGTAFTYSLWGLREAAKNSKNESTNHFEKITTHEEDSEHEQWKTELPKHFALLAIFLTPDSLYEDTEDDCVVKWILSIILALGASIMVLDEDRARCIPQIESGLIYIRDRKCPSIVHASGVWKEYLKYLCSTKCKKIKRNMNKEQTNCWWCSEDVGVKKIWARKWLS